MAFPFLGEELFELGTRGQFDAISDTDVKIDYPHYSELARVPGLPAPYRGAYCMRLNLAKAGGNDAYIQETTTNDLSAAGIEFTRFMIWVGNDLAMADADEFAIFQLWSGTNTAEGSVVLNYTTANGLRIGVGELTGSQFLPMPQGRWVSVELKCVIDSGVGNDGTLDLYVDGYHATQITGLDQAAITSAVLGCVGLDAGTTKGNLLFDWFINDDAQIYAPTERWTEQLLVTASQHAFVGPGQIVDLALLSGSSTDSVVQIFDTDTGNTNDAFRMISEIKGVAASTYVEGAFNPIEVRRGAYVKLGGTAPRAMLRIQPAYWGSDGAVRRYGLKRQSAPQNV